jgi:SAM-dependent methyltransferase
MTVLRSAHFDVRPNTLSHRNSISAAVIQCSRIDQSVVVFNQSSNFTSLCRRRIPVSSHAPIREASEFCSMSDHADKIVSHYERHASDWDADRRGSGWNDRKWHDRFVALLHKGAGVLDLGCGGAMPVARHAVAHGISVTGIDSSPSLIALCRQRLPDQEWMVSDMRRLKLARRFEGILAWDSYFHLTPDDQRAMFEVFCDHACRGAILMFNTGPAFGEAIGNYRGDPLYHASLDSREYLQLLGQHRFELIDRAIEDPQAGGRTVWLARHQ